MVSITPFGQEGPRHAEQRSEFLLQALVGSLRLHGGLDDPPVAVGGRLGEWSAGAYAAAGALAARARSQRTGVGEHVDVSTLECLAVTFLAYPALLAALPGGSRELTMTMVPGIERVQGRLCGSGHHHRATVARRAGHDGSRRPRRARRVERSADPPAPSGRGLCRDESMAHAHTVEEVLELAAAFRVPAAPVGNGANVSVLPHLVAPPTLPAEPKRRLPRSTTAVSHDSDLTAGGHERRRLSASTTPPASAPVPPPRRPGHAS